MTNLYQIQEWKPTDFSHLSGMTASILVGLYLGLTGKLQLPKFRVLLVVALVFVDDAAWAQHATFRDHRAAADRGFLPRGEMPTRC